MASPIPIKMCVPTIAPKTVDTEKVAVAPIAYWIVNPTAAAGTDNNPPIAAAKEIEDLWMEE